MATPSIDLSFLNQGNNLTLTIAQLQAMDAQLKQIADRSPALIELSRAFGVTYAQASKLTQELGVGPAKLREAVATMQQLRAAGADAVTQYSVFANQLGLTVDQMRLLAEQVEELGGQKDVVTDLTAAFSSLFVLDKVNEFKQSIIETGKVLETLETRLKTTLGTQAAADSALDRIQKFASTTPFEMVEVTDAFVKLKQRGIEPTNDALRSLGDLASSQGKGLDQTVEALLDASQGEFERLKEYGIKASAAGDKVNISFQGMNRQIERTPEGISAGILALGKLEGVAGGMELQAQTLGGALSNLTDAQSKLAGKAFEVIQGPAVALVRTATSLIDSFSELNPAMQSFILTTATVGGVLVSAVAALAAFQAAQIGAALATAATTLAETPAAIARGINATITKLAALAEMELVAAKVTANGVTTGGIAATVADTAAKGANTLATIAQNAATKTGIATMAGGKLVFSAGAIAAGVLAGTVLAAGASLALLADSLRAAYQPELELAKSNESLAKSMKATEEAYDKAVKAEQAKADSTAKAAEVARRAALSNEQRAAEDIAREAQITDAYDKSVSERVGIFQKFLDKVREFINIPASVLTKTFEIVAKLPLPGPIKDFFKGVAEQAENLKLKTSEVLFKESDINANADVFDKADKLGEQKRKVAARANAKGAEQDTTKAASAVEITSAVNTAKAIAKLRKDEADSELRQQQQRADILAAQGRKSSAEGLENEKALAKAKLEVQKAAEYERNAEAEGTAKAQKDAAQKSTTPGAKAAGGLANATKAEVESLAASYEIQIAAAEKMSEADANQKTQKEVLIKSLKAEQAEVQQAVKLVLEKEKRIVAVGTAEAQWAAETKKVTENIGKQIATSEDANKLLETTKKQFEAGFISPEKAAEAFQKVAQYTQATGDVQQAAAAELLNVRVKGFETDKALAASRLALAELNGVLEITNAEQTASAVAKVRKEQADLELKQQQEKYALLSSQGKQAGTEGLATERAIAKAKIDADKAAAEEQVALRKEAIAKINKALEDAAFERQKAEAKASTGVKKDVIEGVKSGNLSTEKADESIANEAADRQEKALDAEIQLKIQKQRELSQIQGTEAKDAAKKLSLEILQLQDKAADLELATIKRVQAQKLKLIRETAEKARALQELATATDENVQAAKDLEAYRKLGADRQQIDADSAKAKLESTAKRLEAELDAIEKEAEATAALNLDRETAEKNRIAFATKTQAKLAEISKNALDQFKAEQAAKQKLLDDAVKDANTEISNTTGQANADDERRSAELRLAAARGNSNAIIALARGEADAKEGIALRQAEQAAALVAVEAEALEKRIELDLVAAKDIDSERQKIAIKTNEAETKLIEATIANEKRLREDLLKYRLGLFDKVKQALAAEQEQINQINALASAQNALEAAQSQGRDLAVNGRKQELVLAKEAAEALGNKSLAETLGRKAKELELNVIIAQADEIKRQFDLKRSTLELDIKSKEIAAEQLVLEKEMSVLEAKSQLDSARAEGRSAVELDALAKKVGFAEKSLELANKGKANTAKISELQRDTLDIDKGNALQANAQQVRAAQVRLNIGDKRNLSQIAIGGLGVSTQAEARPEDLKDPAKVPSSADKALADSKALLKLPAPDYSAVNASSKLLSTTFNELSAQAKDMLKNVKVETKVKDDEFVKMFGLKFDQLDKTLQQAILQRDAENKSSPKGAGGPTSGARASGGPTEAGGTYLVGELGPELVTFAQDSHVFSATQTKAMLAAMSNVPAAVPDKDNSQLLTELQKLNAHVSKSRSEAPINVPVNVTTNDANAVAQALAIVRADRAARHKRL